MPQPGTAYLGTTETRLGLMHQVSSMSALLLLLASIALLDSTSIVPLCIVPLAALLGAPRPLALGASFVGGIFSTMFGVGVLLVVGLDALFDALGPAAARLWNEPKVPELALQTAIGGALVAFGWRMRRRRSGGAPPQETRGDLSPLRASGLGAGLAIVGLPGAFPYFGAVDLLLRADLTTAGWVLALVFYNVVFVSPLAALVVVRAALPDHSEAIFARVSALAERWGHRLVVAALMLVGVVLFADGVGWLLGVPVLPLS